ncbi:hypothetical protein [uncultured Clostridium sp.]|uniref:hypothetical protein n=1 Tax=uncultured Clostridium sp. TaxID=59620 RepID=UPI0032179840
MGVNLFQDGKVKTNDREFTRILGGFSDTSPMFTIFQAGELLGLRTAKVVENFERNEVNFELNVDYIDLKSAIPSGDKTSNINISKLLISTGCTQNKLNATKRWLAFSFSGMVKLLYICDIYNKEKIHRFLMKYFNISDNFILIKSRFETQFRVLIEESFKNIVNFIPQYSCCNNKYRIDFYSPIYNLAVEYDEGHHKYHKDEDKERELNIWKELHCNFIRVDKNKELEGINKIMIYILDKTNKMEEAI